MMAVVETSEKLPTSDFEWYADAHQDYIALLGAIIRSGIKDEGADFLRSPDGQRLCWMGGLESEVVWTQARREQVGKRYSPRGEPRRRVEPTTASFDKTSTDSNNGPGQMERVPHGARRVLSDASVVERYAGVICDQERLRKRLLPWNNAFRIGSSKQ
jgi:hypothetical protein